MSTTERLWQRVQRELALHPKEIDVRALAQADWVLHHRASPEVVRALEHQEASGDLARAWITLRQFSRAHAVASQPRPNGQYLRLVAVAQMKAGAESDALQTITAIPPTRANDKEIALIDVVEVLAERRNFARALQIASTTNLGDGRKSYAYYKIAEAQFAAKAHDAARANLREAIRLANDSAYTEYQLEKLIPLQIRCGDREEAKQNLARLVVEVESHPSDTMRRYGFCYIVTSYLALGDIPAAKALAESHPITTGALAQPRCDIAVAQARAGDLVGARQTFALAAQGLEQREREADLERYAVERGAGFLRLASAQAQVKLRQDAQTSFTRAFHIYSSMPSAFQKSLSLGGLAVAQAEAGFFLETTRLLQRMEESQERTEVVRLVALLQARAGDVTGARQTIATIKDGYRKAEALADLGVVQAQHKDLRGSRHTFLEAIEVGLPKAGPKANWYPIERAIEAQASTGDCIGTLHSLKIARARLGTRYIRFVGRSVAVMLARAGEIDRALAMVAYLPSGSERIATLCEAILARKGAVG